MNYTLGFIGAGNMAEAIVRGAIAGNIVPAARMSAFDPSPARCELFRSLGVTIATGNAQVARESAQLLLAVKPQMFPTVAAELAPALTGQHILISIMAGLSSAKIASLLNGSMAESPARAFRLIRVMPNTPLMVGLGMSGLARGAAAQPGDEALALRLFSAAGKAILVPEEKIDAVTAISGSGPAYLFYLAEAMEQAAASLGLAGEARTLVQQTLLGAATLLSQSPDTAAQLRQKVTSPGGTTQAAITHMENHHLRETIVAALQAAEKRAKELGK